MKDPRYTEDLLDISLALRIRLEATTKQFQSAIDDFEDSEQASGSTADAVVRRKIKFSRASETNVATLRNLPPATNILLFTPVIIPAGHPGERDPVAVQKAFERQRMVAEAQKLALKQGHGTIDPFAVETQSSNIETMDPFEAFGRALSTYHRRIRHVPYVAQKGFTATHENFVSQADAVITVVCEPDFDKDRSVSNQMDFAEEALDSLERNAVNVANALVLVQCGANQYRLPVDASFMNVIECQIYNAETAKAIARTIFEARI